MLDEIGVGAGWRCVDLGCGPLGILDLLARRVGPTGAVVGVDRDPANYLAALDLIGHRRNVTLVPADGRETPLPRGAFDLVHARLVCQETGAGPLLREMMALVKPGGFVVLEEPGFEPWRIEPAPTGFEALAPAVTAAFLRRRSSAGPALAAQLRRHGAVGIETHEARLAFRGGHPYAAMPLFALLGARPALLGARRASPATLDRLAADLARASRDPDIRHSSFPLWQVWGRRRGTRR